LFKDKVKIKTNIKKRADHKARPRILQKTASPAQDPGRLPYERHMYAVHTEHEQQQLRGKGHTREE